MGGYHTNLPLELSLYKYLFKKIYLYMHAFQKSYKSLPFKIKDRGGRNMFSLIRFVAYLTWE